MERQEAVNKIVIENIARRKKLRAEYNPITGEGLPCDKPWMKRAWLEIPDFSIPRQFVPVEMLNVDLIKQLVHYGSIEAFLKNYPWTEGGDFSHERVEKEIIKLREKFDFPFWAFFEIHIDDKEGRGVIPFKLNYAQLVVEEECERLRKLNAPIHTIICKARQWGGSTYSIFKQSWIALKWRSNHSFSVCAQVNGVAVSITQMLAQALKDYHPWALNVKGKELNFVQIPKSN